MIRDKLTKTPTFFVGSDDDPQSLAEIRSIWLGLPPDVRWKVLQKIPDSMQIAVIEVNEIPDAPNVFNLWVCTEADRSINLVFEWSPFANETVH